LPWQLQFIVEFNSLNKFVRDSWKEHLCKVSTNLAKWFWRRSCLKTLLTHRRTNHGRQTQGHHISSPLGHDNVLRWAHKSDNLWQTTRYYYIPNIKAVGLVVFDKKIYKDILDLKIYKILCNQLERFEQLW